jgi:hypothetical protein
MNYLIYGINRAAPRVAIAIAAAIMAVLLSGLLWLEWR